MHMGYFSGILSFSQSCKFSDASKYNVYFQIFIFRCYIMGPKRRQPVLSPAQSAAKKLKSRYISPRKSQRVRRALYAVSEKKVSIRKAAEEFDLSFGYLYRRLSGEVDLESRNGPKTVFTTAEETAMATWLKEMSERGMGLQRFEFLDFVQNLVVKEGRKTPFKEGRPSHEWYRAFLSRNSHIIQTRHETPLESCRAKLTKDHVDKWFCQYRDFVLKLGLDNKPKRIFNADETGFSLGSKAGKVIGPLKEKAAQVPHVTGGQSKQRLTVMFCGSANGDMLPPFMVYPPPPPRGYNPLTGALENSHIAYTAKGWMDSSTFQKFIEHFDKFCGDQRPVILLIDSVSSHVYMDAFEFAKSKGIELYRLVPNATHIMQPLDKGVFGPLKKRWYQVMRRHSRENPGSPVGKHNFAELLKQCFLLFYKPLTIINSFKSSGIYPVDSTVVTSSVLKPSLTFSEPETSPSMSSTELSSTSAHTVEDPHDQSAKDSASALQVFESVLQTPVRLKYKRRIQENYDIEGQSPCFDTYKKLYIKSKGKQSAPATMTYSQFVESEEQALAEDNTSTSASIEPNSNLDLLASVVCSEEDCQLPPAVSVPLYSPEAGPSSSEDVGSEKTKSCFISPFLEKSLVFPHVAKTEKSKRKTFIQEMPDNLTSPDALRKMALRDLDKIKKFAAREKSGKIKFNKMLEKKKVPPKPVKRKSNSKSKRAPDYLEKDTDNSCSDDVCCMGCHMSWDEDQTLGYGSVWIQCDQCQGWMHEDCCGHSVDHIVSSDDKFYCPECEF